MKREPRFRGVCQNCGSEIMTPPPSQDSRAFWWACVVKTFAEATGEPSLLVAHYQLKILLGCTSPVDEVLSTADAAIDQGVQSDLILRASAFLAQQQIFVPEPEPDPVLRLECAS